MAFRDLTLPNPHTIYAKRFVGQFDIPHADEDTHGLLSALEQTIGGEKTFVEIPSCTLPPTDPENLTNKAYVDNLVLRGISWIEPVNDFYDASTSLPSEPVDGDRYICSVAGNEWLLHSVYTYLDESWDVFAPSEGCTSYIDTLDLTYVFNGVEWVKTSLSVDHNDLMNKGVKTHSDIDKIWSGTDNSTSTSTGALVMAGGLGVAGGVNIGCNENVNGIITSNKMIVVNQLPTSAKLIIEGYSSVNADYTAGARGLTGTISVGGTGTIVANTGKIEITASSSASTRVVWDVIDSNIDNTTGSGTSTTGSGAIRFKYTPRYSGFPTSTNEIIHLSSPIYQNIRLRHTTIGLFEVNVYSSAPAQILNALSSSFNVVSGNEYEIEIDWNYNIGNSSGFVYLFVDGVQKIYSTYATTSISPTTILQIGGFKGNNCGFRDIVLYNAVQHTTSYLTGYSSIHSIMASTLRATDKFSIINSVDTTKSALMNVDTSGVLTINASGNVVKFDLTDQVQVLGTTQSTSTSTGALILSGGVGIVKDLFVGGSFNVSGDINNGSSSSTVSFTGSCEITDTLKCYKIGHLIVIDFPYKTGTATALSHFTATEVIPLALRPDKNIRTSIFVTDTNTEIVGSCTITTTGDINVYAGSSGNFTVNGVAGFSLNIQYVK